MSLGLSWPLLDQTDAEPDLLREAKPELAKLNALNAAEVAYINSLFAY